jgi:hypothetical protein
MVDSTQSINPQPSTLNQQRWALRVAMAAMALTMLPYLFGYTLLGANPARGWFSWLGYNLDDSCVYLSWMRQAADGHFFQRNLFTTEPQWGHQFNLFFLALGGIAGLAHLPLLLVYHAARLILGIAFLRAVWWLIEMLLADARAQRAAYLVVCFSAGLGWLPGLWRQSGINSPVDVWQPESTTFLCLYLSPLFLVSLLLMAGVLGWLWVAEQRRSWRPSVYAGMCGLLLGNIHTYDVITLCVIWGGFLLARAVVQKRWNWGAWGRALVAGALTAVSTGYMFYLVKTEAVFAQRVAVPTLSPAFSLYALGYGPVLVLALVGALGVGRAALENEETRKWGNGEMAALSPGSDSRLTTHDSRLFLIVWSVLNIAVAYLPVSFNRKMLMGAHVPLAILAGVALWRLLRRFTPPDPPLRKGGTKGGWRWPAGLAAALLLLSPTNGRFMLRDAQNFQDNRGQSRIQRPYMYAGEVQALLWLREHAPPGAAIQPLPWIIRISERQIAFFDTTVACFTPGLTGHPVHAGHWGETPDFPTTMGLWARFLNPATPDAWRRDLLRRSKVRYVVFTQKHDETQDETTENYLLSVLRGSPPPYLRLLPEASNADADVYEVF